MSVLQQNDERIRLALAILHPFRTRDAGFTPMQRAINDAFSVIERGQTVAEEKKEFDGHASTTT